MFGADPLSETDCCIATRQNKMAAPILRDEMFLIYFIVLRWRALCRNDHRTQHQSLKQVFYEKFLVWKSCHFGRHFKKRSKQTDSCIARTNRYRARHESAFLMQLTSGFDSSLETICMKCQILFSEKKKIKKMSSICHLLNQLREWKRLNIYS